MKSVYLVKRTTSLEKISYIMPFVGCAADQLSTRIGLTNSNLREMNSLTTRFMALGAWLYIDLAAVLVTILVPHLLIGRFGFRYKQLLLMFPLTYSILKLATGLSNIYLYLTY